MKYRWLLFDADNTLFDFDAAEDRAITNALSSRGYDPTPERKALYCKLNAALWTAYDRGEIRQEELVIKRFQDLSDALGGHEDPQAWNRCYLDGLAAGSILLPGALALCRALAPHYILALVTNGVPYVQRSRLAVSPVAPLFGARVFISGEMGCQKPEQVYFEAVLKALAVDDPARVLVLGDSLTSDIQGAVNAGLDSVWYNPKHRPAGRVRPTYEADSYDGILSLLLP